MIISDQYWTTRAKELKATGKTDPFDEDRVYQDQCDGEIWQDHELSFIHISEPTRQAEISYAALSLKK